MDLIKKAKTNKKGFTLVELLVVLVILAVLAAAIIPSMLGFIDKAREESAAAECRSVLLATTVVLNEKYGTEGNFVNKTDKTEYVLVTADIAAVKAIADLPGTIGAITAIQDPKADAVEGHAIVGEATYTTSQGATYVYTSTTGVWTKQ